MKVLKMKYGWIMLLILTGCQKIYHPELDETDKLILVVESSLTNTEGPHWVSLNYAGNLNDSYQYNPAYCDDVSIIDNMGNEFKLKSKSLGYYTTQQGELTGMPGRKYKLRLVFGNGEIYESLEETMPGPVSEIETTGEWGYKTEIDKNAYGELIEKKVDGIYTRLDFNTDEKAVQLKVKTSIITQTTRVIDAEPFPYVEYCWGSSTISELPMIEKSIEKNDRFYIKNFNVGFLQYITQRVGISPVDSTPAFIDVNLAGWVVTYDVYSITKSNYLFYEDLNEQLQAKNYIFDPVPSQLSGNMRCITNEHLMITGSFEVMAHKRFYRAFKKNADHVVQKVLDTYERPEFDSCVTHVEPEFWINFN